MIKYSKRAEGPAQSSTLKTISQLFCWECEGVAYMSRAPATRRVLMLLPRSGSSSRMANPCPTIMARVGHWAVTGGWGGGGRWATTEQQDCEEKQEKLSQSPRVHLQQATHRLQKAATGSLCSWSHFQVTNLYIFLYIYAYILQSRLSPQSTTLL